jgi:AcrR family transcriptional regulator
MSPRPRKATDDDIFTAAYTVMQRVGPGELTLADIAAEAGVTAGALVQRFGSKRDLLLRLSDRFAGGTAQMFDGLRASHRSPLAVIRAYGDCMAAMAATPAALIRSLSYLLVDLADDDLRKNLAASARGTRTELQRLIREAVRAGELSSEVNARQLARTLEAVIGGSLLSWAYHQDGSARKWIRDDVNAVLRPYLTSNS